jgi:hypothetical protein|tara:strand:- start:281 stop:523 length:243 start_codon:yes stop_codon:yes gene_type:complete
MLLCIYDEKTERENMIGETLEFNYGAMFAPVYGVVISMKDDVTAEVLVDGDEKLFMDLVDITKIKTYGVDSGVGVYFDVA